MNNSSDNANCANSSLNSEDKQGALYAVGILGSLSTIPCLTAVVLVFVFKLHKNFAHRLALYQVLAALFYGIIAAIQLAFVRYPKLDGDDIGCAVIGFFSVFSLWVKLMFTSWVVLHLFCFSVFYKDLQHKIIEKLFVCISIGFPLLFVWIPFISWPTGINSTTIAYGSAGAWCWIKNWKNDCSEDKFLPGIVEQFILWYGPALFCSIANSIAIIIIIARFTCCKPNIEKGPLLKSGQRMKALKELLPLLVYPILFCALLIPPLVNRIVGAIPNIQVGIITPSTVISGICIPLQSLLAGIALLVHIAVLKRSKCKCFQKPKQHHHTKERTFSSEHPVTWKLMQGDTATIDVTEVFLPNESEVDNLLLTQKAAQARV